ncbi:hypothetical protein MMC21_000963 [Puttea exsequens]|nr:hypothetical protein [Puttea exsequens]
MCECFHNANLFHVVDKNSALLGLSYPQEDAIPVPESNHSNICKFGTKTQNYELVVSGIADLVDWALKEISNLQEPSILSISDDDSSSSPSVPYRNTQVSYAYLPDFSGVSSSSSEEPKRQISFAGPFYLWPSINFEQFTGREGLMKSIQEALLIERSHQTRLALYGLGGVGKTQIALQLIQRYRTDCPNESIFWIHGGSGDMLRQSLTEIALRCNLLRPGDITTEPLDAVRRFLLNVENGRWLMVVDNADVPNTFIKPSSTSSSTSQDQHRSQRAALGTYIPRCAHGRIVFTTKSKSFGEIMSMQGCVIEIPPLCLPEACELLQKRLFEDMQLAESPPSYQREIPTNPNLEKLCEYLDCLPLALSQAAAFMRQQNVTVGKYIQLLDDDESRLSELLEHNFKAYGPEDDFSKAIASTWSVTFDLIVADAPIAADLLSFMAFLDSKNIPKFLLRYVETNEWNLTVTGLGTLQGYALVNLASKNETLSIHRLVQHAMRKRLVSIGASTKWSRKALSVLSENFPDGEYESWETCVALIPHASHILTNDFPKNTEDMLLIATLQSKLSQYYSRMGLYSQTVKLTLKTLETFGQCPDAPKKVVYQTKSLRAEALKNNNQLKEAEDLAKELWYEQQNELGAKHVDTLKSYNTLALMYQEQGKYKEGAKIARFTLKSLRKTFNENDITIQDTKRRLGTILHMLGAYAEAEILLREAVEVYKDQLGPDDHITLKAKWRLAWILHDQGKYREVERVISKTWTAQKRTIGENHPDCLRSLFLLADVLQAQSKFEAALSFKRNVYAQALVLAGPKHRYTLVAAASLASCLVASVSAKGSSTAYEEASKLYDVVLKGREELLLPDHPETLSVRTDVATMLRLRESLSEAETLERETLKRAKRVLERDHPIVLASRESLACILWAQKDSKANLKEAAEQIKKVLKAKEKRYGWNYSDTLATAKLVMEMAIEGKGKEQMRKKITQSSTAINPNSTFVESSDEDSKSALMASKDLPSIKASGQSSDTERTRELLKDTRLDA